MSVQMTFNTKEFHLVPMRPFQSINRVTGIGIHFWGVGTTY